jgi:hypothetical protein
MSLQLVLASLFPPLPTDVIDDTLNWQPVPFNIEPGQGLIGTSMSYCPNYINKYYSYVLSEEAQEISLQLQLNVFRLGRLRFHTTRLGGRDLSKNH